MGAVTFIYGAWEALQGLHAYVIGAIPGIISMLTGGFVFQTGHAAKKFFKIKNQEIRSTNDLLKYYGYFLYTAIDAKSYDDMVFYATYKKHA